MEIEKLIETVNDKAKAAVADAFEQLKTKMITAEDFQKRIENLVTKEQLNTLTKAVEEQGLALREMQVEKKPEFESISKRLQESQKELQKAVSTKGSLNLKFKAVSRASIANSTFAMRLPDVGDIPTIDPKLQGLFSQGSISPNNNGVIRYLDRQPTFGGTTSFANATAELDEKPTGTYGWIERLARIETIAVWTEVSRQSVEDLEFLASELESLMRLDLSLAIDKQLYSGDGISPNLAGVYTVAPSFTASGGFTNPNVYDLILHVATSIASGADRLFSPNVALVNPLTLLSLKTQKASNGHYVLPPFASPDGRTIEGMAVIPTAQVAPNTLLVGDFRYGTVFTNGEVNVEIGWQNNQFVRNAFTILAETKLCLLIKGINAAAFRKVENITDALADMAA